MDKRFRILPNLQAEEYILACMLIIGLVLFPNPLGRKLLLLKQASMALGLIALSFIHLRKKQVVFFPLQVIPLALAGLVGLSFLSFLWAYHPSKTWLISVKWLLLLLFYLNLKACKIDRFNLAFWKGLLLAILAVNLLLTAWLFLKLGNTRPDMGLLGDKLLLAYTYISYDANSIASILMLLGLISLCIKPKPYRNLNYFLSFLAAVSIIMLGSKALVGGLLLIAFLLLLKSKHEKRLGRNLLIGIIAAGFIGVILFLVKGNAGEFLDEMNPINSLVNQTGDDRGLLWSSAWKLFVLHPIEGVGSGNYMTELLQFGMGDYGHFRSYRDAHNLFFETLAELGWAGGLLILILLFYPIFSFLKKPLSSRKEVLIFLILMAYILQSAFYIGAYGVNGRFSAPMYIWIGALAFIPFPKKIKIRNFPVGKALLVLSLLSLLFWAFYIRQILVFKAYRIAHQQEQIDKTDALYNQLYVPHFHEFIDSEYIPGIHGRYVFEASRYQTAKPFLENATQHSPHEYKNWETLGACCEKLSDFTEAIDAYQHALQLNPKQVKIAYQLAKLGFEHDNQLAYEEGLAVYHQFILPQIESLYNPETWFPDNPTANAYGNQMCRLQDLFILLEERKERKEQRVENRE